MSAPLALILATLLALPSVAIAQAEEEVLSAIRGRLDAAGRNDAAAWSKFVADDMMAPLEGAVRSKQGWIRQHQSWPREVTYGYGPLQDVKVRINGDTAIVTFHAQQFTKIGEQTTSSHKWQIETHVRRDGRWQLLGIADALIPPEPTAATPPNGCRRRIRHSSCPAKQRAGTPRASSSSGTPAVASRTTSIVRWARPTAS